MATIKYGGAERELFKFSCPSLSILAERQRHSTVTGLGITLGSVTTEPRRSRHLAHLSNSLLAFPSAALPTRAPMAGPPGLSASLRQTPTSLEILHPQALFRLTSSRV